MEKPDLRIKNIMINGLVVLYWAFVFFASFIWGFKLVSIAPPYSFIIQTLVFVLFAWPIKMYWINIYMDALVFKKQGFHPKLKSDFGVLLDNISDYKIEKIIFNFYWLVFKRENGKTIRRISSMSEKQCNFLSNKLAEKVKPKKNIGHRYLK
jgi:hypothetical protein